MAFKDIDFEKKAVTLYGRIGVSTERIIIFFVIRIKIMKIKRVRKKEFFYEFD